MDGGGGGGGVGVARDTADNPLALHRGQNSRREHANKPGLAIGARGAIHTAR